jgi:hypothetical protein
LVDLRFALDVFHAIAFSFESEVFRLFEIARGDRFFGIHDTICLFWGVFGPGTKDADGAAGEESGGYFNRR